MKRRVFVFLMIVALVLSATNITAFAADTALYAHNHEETENLEQALTKAVQFGRNVLEDDSYEYTLGFYDLEEVCRYLYVDFGMNGYVIVEFRSLSIVEAGSSRNAYIVENEKIYYTGPLSYYIKDNTGFVKLYPTAKAEDNMNDAAIQELPLVSGVIPLAQTNYSVTISGVVRNYSYNPVGICGSTAAAMWLMYMDEYYNDNYVAQALETADGITLILTIAPYIDGAVPGSTGETLQNGLQQYLYDRGITLTVRQSGWSSSVVKSQISDNKPIMVAVSNHPTYGNHWVTAYGYYVERSPNIAYLIVNDGHGGQGIYINPSYVDYLVY